MGKHLGVWTIARYHIRSDNIGGVRMHWRLVPVEPRKQILKVSGNTIYFELLSKTDISNRLNLKS
jgi:hypothetical protein